MSNYEIALEYANCVLHIFDKLVPILYGSSAIGVNGNDLDMCFISNNDLTKEQLSELIKITKYYHYKYNLKIDEEVPYENKLIYTMDFINDTFNKSPFPFINGKYIIPKIIKSQEFLSSTDMKKRLLLNILTTNHIVTSNDFDLINNYSKEAMQLMIKTLISYGELIEFSFEDLYDVFIKDPYSKLEGEWYLGYKTNHIEKILYLKKELLDGLNSMIDDNIIDFSNNKYYVKKR